MGVLVDDHPSPAGTSNFRTRITVASSGSRAMLKPRSRHMDKLISRRETGMAVDVTHRKRDTQAAIAVDDRQGTGPDRRHLDRSAWRDMGDRQHVDAA